MLEQDQAIGLAVTDGPNVAEDLPTMDMIVALEKAAELAPRFMKALRNLMIHVTFPSDWHIEGDKACLSGPGAERVANAIGGFVIGNDPKIDPFRSSLEASAGYMWTYSVIVQWKGRSVHAQGHYSTRDKFLGKKGGEFRDTADINEADIKRAARHNAIGEGVKQLLGLRGLPASELPDFAGGGKPASVKRSYDADSAADENQQRRAITDMLLALCGGDKDAAIAELENVTAFKGRDGDMVKGVTQTSSLRGKRLQITFETVEREYNKSTGGGE